MNTRSMEDGVERMTSIKIGGRCQALSLSPDGQFVAVGGRDVFKIISTAGDEFSFFKNLRPRKSNLNYSINAIHWHPSLATNQAVSGANNGVVVLWNMDMSGPRRQVRVYEEHKRTVNSVCWFNEEHELVSGSSDGSVILWDTRQATSALTINAKFNAVRDAQASPHSKLFASAHENGLVQVWDPRNSSNPLHALRSHNGLVLSVDWHPTNPNMLATGGVRPPSGGAIKVWDLNDTTRPRHAVQTSASVAKIKWRPNHDSHIASSASLMDFKVHVWDVSEPYIPLATWSGHSEVATGIQWLDSGDSLMSCSKDEMLVEHFIDSALFPHEHITSVALSWSPQGQLATVMEQVNRNRLQSSARSALLGGIGASVGLPFLRSPLDNATAETDAIESHTVQIYRDTSMATLQEVADSVEVQSEDDPLRVRFHHPSPPSAGDDAFGFFAAHYKLTGDSVAARCFHNAAVARAASRLRLAQMWQTLGLTFTDYSEEVLLMRRLMEEDRKKRAMAEEEARRVAAVKGQLQEWSRKMVQLQTTNNDAPTEQNGREARIPDPNTEDSAVSIDNDLGAIGPDGTGEAVNSPDVPHLSTALSAIALMREVSRASDDVADTRNYQEVMNSPNADDLSIGDQDDDDAESALGDVEQFASPSPSSVAGNEYDSTNSGSSRGGSIGDAADYDEPLDVFDSRDSQRLLAARVVSDEEEAAGDLAEENEQTERQHGSAAQIAASLQAMSSMYQQGQRPRRDTAEAAQAASSRKKLKARSNDVSISASAQRLLSCVPMAAPVEASRGIAQDARVAVNVLDSSFSRELVAEFLELSVGAGDVQSCVAVFLVVKDELKLEVERCRHWCFSYIDLLQRHQLFAAATEIMQLCGFEDIGNINKQSTTVYVTCPHCQRSSQHIGTDCKHCGKSMTSCSICRQPVDGQYVWCQGCGHGGHLGHMREWFRANSVCPTGCMHNCLDTLR